MSRRTPRRSSRASPAAERGVRRLDEPHSVELNEIVLSYRQGERDAWDSGDRSLVPCVVDPNVYSAPPWSLRGGHVHVTTLDLGRRKA